MYMKVYRRSVGSNEGKKEEFWRVQDFVKTEWTPSFENDDEIVGQLFGGPPEWGAYSIIFLRDRKQKEHSVSRSEPIWTQKVPDPTRSGPTTLAEWDDTWQLTALCYDSFYG